MKRRTKPLLRARPGKGRCERCGGFMLASRVEAGCRQCERCIRVYGHNVNPGPPEPFDPDRWRGWAHAAGVVRWRMV